MGTELAAGHIVSAVRREMLDGIQPFFVLPGFPTFRMDLANLNLIWLIAHYIPEVYLLDDSRSCPVGNN